jgi:hypothetical protein
MRSEKRSIKSFESAEGGLVGIASTTLSMFLA